MRRIWKKKEMERRLREKGQGKRRGQSGIEKSRGVLVDYTCPSSSYLAHPRTAGDSERLVSTRSLPDASSSLLGFFFFIFFWCKRRKREVTDWKRNLFLLLHLLSLLHLNSRIKELELDGPEFIHHMGCIKRPFRRWAERKRRRGGSRRRRRRKKRRKGQSTFLTIEGSNGVRGGQFVARSVDEERRTEERNEWIMFKLIIHA